MYHIILDSSSYLLIMLCQTGSLIVIFIKPLLNSSWVLYRILPNLYSDGFGIHNVIIQLQPILDKIIRLHCVIKKEIVYLIQSLYQLDWPAWYSRLNFLHNLRRSLSFSSAYNCSLLQLLPSNLQHRQCHERKVFDLLILVMLAIQGGKGFYLEFPFSAMMLLA